MKARIIVSCTALFLAAGTSAVYAEQQWICKYHAADPNHPGPDFPFKLIESETSLDAFLDDLGGLPSRFRVVWESKDGVIAIIPDQMHDGPSLHAFLLDKKEGAMKMTMTMTGTYEESYLGRCDRSPK